MVLSYCEKKLKLSYLMLGRHQYSAHGAVQGKVPCLDYSLVWIWTIICASRGDSSENGDHHMFLQAVNFFCFDMYRKAFLKAVGPELRNEAKVAAGALAGKNHFPARHSCRMVFLSTLLQSLSNPEQNALQEVVQIAVCKSHFCKEM